MPRPQKKQINLTKESMLSLMQEIYNELVEQRNTAIRIQNKMLSFMKDPEDMQTIGPIVKEQQKIINVALPKSMLRSRLAASRVHQVSQISLVSMRDLEIISVNIGIARN